VYSFQRLSVLKKFNAIAHLLNGQTLVDYSLCIVCRSNVILLVPVTVHREQSVKREKTNKMQESDVYYQLLSQHVSGIIMPIFRRKKDRVLLHMVYCAGSAGFGW
jgi:hypothetical protein